MIVTGIGFKSNVNLNVPDVAKLSPSSFNGSWTVHLTNFLGVRYIPKINLLWKVGNCDCYHNLINTRALLTSVETKSIKDNFMANGRLITKLVAGEDEECVGVFVYCRVCD